MMQRFIDLNEVNLKILEENRWKDESIRANIIFISIERYKFVKSAVRRIV